MPKVWRLSDEEAQRVVEMLTWGGKNNDSGANGCIMAGGLLMSLRSAPAEDPDVAQLRAEVAKLREGQEDEQ